MTQEELPKQEDYFAELNTIEKLVFNRLVGDRKVDDAYPEVHQAMEQLTITAGFTIDDIGGLMADFRSGRQTEKDQEVARIIAECKGDPVPNQSVIPQLIGWVFKFPKNEGTRLVRSIRVERMDMFLSATGTTFPEIPLLHTNGNTVTLRPKVFYQRSTVNTEDFALPYGLAFPHTEPGMFDAPDLTMADLEGYFRWSDLAMLQRGHLADFADFIFADGASVYNDLFFSGARLDYQTMHNPGMRLEQLNLKDSATRDLIGQPDSRTPFTLKAEPFIADTRRKKDGSSTGEKVIVRGAVVNVAGVANTANIGEVESAPVSAHLLPCPTLWDYSSALAINAVRQIKTTNAVPVHQIQAAFLARFSENDSTNGAVSVSTVTTSNRPRILPVGGDTPTPKPPTSRGCMVMFLTIIFLIVCLSLM